MIKEELQNKLSDAFKAGFVPAEIKTYMNSNGHNGHVWLVPQEDVKEVNQIGDETVLQRIGIGYKLIQEDKTEHSHIHVYSLPEAEAILREWQ